MIEIFPVLAPAGTTAVTCEADTDDGATPTPPNETELAPDRFDPDTVTNVPTGPDVGEKFLIDGVALGGRRGQPPIDVDQEHGAHNQTQEDRRNPAP